VGDCLEDEHVNPENGDVEQRTTGGLLILRETDGVARFTDGVTNWVNEPDGLQTQAVPSSGDTGTAASPPANTTAGVPSLFVMGPPEGASTGASDAPAPAPPPTAPTAPTATNAPPPTATSAPPPTATAALASAATPTRPPAPGPSATSVSASTPGRTSPVGGQCPATHQIKGVTSSNGQKLYYEPDRPDYAKATPEACFTAGGDARDAGYVSSKR
jgi:hypothetical protein